MMQKAQEEESTTVISGSEAVGAFASFVAQQAAFYDLRAPGAHSVLEEAIGELEGVIAGVFFVGSYVALAALLRPSSTLAALIGMIGIGRGLSAVLGMLPARCNDKHHTDANADEIWYGGILMWVRCLEAERENLVVEIRKGRSDRGRDVHMNGWSQ